MRDYRRVGIPDCRLKEPLEAIRTKLPAKPSAEARGFKLAQCRLAVRGGVVGLLGQGFAGGLLHDRARGAVAGENLELPGGLFDKHFDAGNGLQALGGGAFEEQGPFRIVNHIEDDIGGGGGGGEKTGSVGGQAGGGGGGGGS